MSDHYFSPGDKVQFLPEWQDPGDSDFERVVIEAPEGSPRVLVETVLPGFSINPTERVDSSMLELVSRFNSH